MATVFRVHPEPVKQPPSSVTITDLDFDDVLTIRVALNDFSNQSRRRDDLRAKARELHKQLGSI